MISLAFKMLIGNRASCIAIIFGIFLATLLISQQSAIFLGLIQRSYRIVTDITEPDIWVVDPVTESEDKLRSLPISYLDVVRSTPGLEWAVPLNSALIPLVTPEGKFDITQLYGIDDATLIGAPNEMLEGSVLDLRREGAVIVDVYSANSSLAKVDPDGKKRSLTLGDTLEINGKYALVVGICKVTQNFYPQPIMYTSSSQFKVFYPPLNGRTKFIIAKSKRGADTQQVCNLININTDFSALTRDQFKDKIRDFFLKTGILINFGLSVLLGVIIGFSIAGQTFYIMTLENIVYYALIKAVGGTSMMLLKMIVFQATVVGIIGYLIGIGVTVLWGMAMEGTTLAFFFPWELLVFTAGVILIICVFTATLCLRKVLRADPQLLMGS